MLTYICFVLGFALLIKGGSLLIDGSVSIANRMKISHIVIGLTVVSLGTTAPEFFITLTASIKGNSDLIIGNIIGSNITNILLILGIASLIFPIVVKRETVINEVPFSLLAALVLSVLANDRIINGQFPGLSRIDGLILIAFVFIFFYYVYRITKSKRDLPGEIEEANFGYAKSLIWIFLGLISLALGSRWVVEGAVAIASYLKISETVVGFTMVAIGTSLPELITATIAAFKKRTDISIGNIIGSNVINTFWILGMGSLIRPIHFSPETYPDIIMNIVAGIILFLALYIGKRHAIERWQGGAMILIYFIFISIVIYTQ